MTALVALVGHDARLQYRYGIYVAYAFVVGFYVLVLCLGRGLLPSWALALVIYSDPAAVGFFFLGALMMLEKGEGVRTALATSPVTAAQYLMGKMVTLTSVALLASLIVMLVHRQVLLNNAGRCRGGCACRYRWRQRSWLGLRVHPWLRLRRSRLIWRNETKRRNREHASAAEQQERQRTALPRNVGTTCLAR